MEQICILKKKLLVCRRKNTKCTSAYNKLSRSIVKKEKLSRSFVARSNVKKVTWLPRSFTSRVCMTHGLTLHELVIDIYLNPSFN